MKHKECVKCEIEDECRGDFACAHDEKYNATSDQTAKADAGKPRLSLVPTQIIYDIAEVREYGNKKYGDPENWRSVEMQRYKDAAYRHWLAFIENPNGRDEESGLLHIQHVACNVAFIRELMEVQA